MKLVDFFMRATRRSTDPEQIDPSARPGNDRTDRSSMADLVRLLQEHDQPQKGSHASAS